MEVMDKAAEGDDNTNVCSFIRLCFIARHCIRASVCYMKV